LGRSLALDELHDVLLGNAAAESGAGDLREADTVLASNLADERGGSGFFLFVLRGGCWRRRRSWEGFLFFLRCRSRGFNLGWRRFGRSRGGFAIDGDRADDGVYTDGRSFADFDFLKDP